MDAISPQKYAGMTIIHIVICCATELSKSKDDKGLLVKFFETLQRRNLVSDHENIFNPNYPINEFREIC
jgi:hypothetical protein